MDIILVNIPIDSTKKPYDEAFPFSKTLNFGILAIASYLVENTLQVSIFDPQVVETTNPLEALCSLIKRERPAIIGLSCISGFGYKSFKKYTFKLKKEFPNTLIVGGGQNHIGILAKTILEECPSLDLIVKGEGEQIVFELFQSIKNGGGFQHIPNIVYRDSSGTLIETSTNDSMNLDIIPKLNYSLYPEFRRFPPAIEVSRGCPYKCTFCSSIQKTLRKKNVSDIISEVENIISIYNLGSISIYFEAPVLSFNSEEIIEITEYRVKKKLNFSWRAETRVEYLSVKRIHNLFESGMRVVDVGMESGSENLLSNMNKTHNPNHYLQMLSAALPEFYGMGLLAKLNILFYLGEDIHTLNETLNYLNNHKKYVQALSAYPVLMYPGSRLFHMRDDILKLGGSIVSSQDWEKRHLYPINPSKEFTYEELQNIGIIIGKSYQDIKTFFTQKSMGYFSPGTTYEEFEEDANRYNIDGLPFSRTKDEMIQAQRQLYEIILRKHHKPLDYKKMGS
jgi:anaerobic magnesium-protoporphyrin IX monomethyl ester cyclase